MVNTNNFPCYIGFGRLNSETISENDLTISADYFFQNKPVHRITHNKQSKNWTIEDIIEGKGMLSCSTELKNAILMYFNNLDCNTNSIFQYIRDKVCSLGNIYFENLPTMKDEGGVTSYYPAGRLVIIRLPIFFDASGHKKVDILTNQIPFRESEEIPLLKLCEAYNTSILLTKKNNENISIPILMLEYIVTIASIYEVTQWICNNDLIAKEKFYRMIIQDSKFKYQHSIQMFNGLPNDDYSAYKIIFKGLDNQKVKFEDFKSRVVSTINNIHF